MRKAQPQAIVRIPDMTPLFSPAGIAAILKSCKDSGVSELRLAELHVRFGRSAETQPFDGQDATLPGKTMPEPDHDKQNQAALEAEELSTREQQIAELEINDPLGAQRLIQQGLLRGNGVETD